MSVRRAGFGLALAALIASPASAAEVALQSLWGKGPSEVRAALLGKPATWPAQRGFELAEPNGAVNYLSLDQLLTEPEQTQRQASLRTRSDKLPALSREFCRADLFLDGPPASGGIILVFKAGRLAQAYGPVRTKPAPPPPVADPQGRRPVRTIFAARHGQLPMEDGLGFLSRWDRSALSGDDKLRVECVPRQIPSARRASRGSRAIDASDMQGLALLPFAVVLPSMNRSRTKARESGEALMAGLQVGAAVSGGPEQFATRTKGVRWHGSTRPGYGVLTIDLGGQPSRNLSDMRDAALIGVEAGRMIWISMPGSVGPHPGLICIDSDGLPATPRPGCHGWGQYKP